MALGRARKRASKGDDTEQFHKGKTPLASTEETRGLAQPDRGEEGPLVGGQGVSVEELGTGLAKGESQSRGGRSGRAEHRGV